MQAALCACLPGPAMAEVVTCDLSGTPVSFAIDCNQLAPAVDIAEPPRRRGTTVQMGDATFPAEPLLIDKVRGFWAEGMGGSDITMVMQPNGDAVLSNARAGQRITCTCEVLQ